MIVILSCTFGLVLSPSLWRVDASAELEGSCMVWTLYLGPVFIALGAERETIATP